MLRARHFSPEAREERIARSLAAVEGPSPIQLDAETWRWVAEDIELEYLGHK